MIERKVFMDAFGSIGLRRVSQADGTGRHTVGQVASNETLSAENNLSIVLFMLLFIVDTRRLSRLFR